MTHFHFFIDSETLHPGASVILEGPEFRHAHDVLRIASGESVTLINGRGVLATGHIGSLQRHHCSVYIDAIEELPRPQLTLSLGLALLRPSHLDIAIEKCTEVGVDQFVLFPADRSERKEPSSSLLRRLDALITAATKQSGRLFRPTISCVGSLEEALAFLPRPHLWADLTPEAVPLTSIPKQPLSLLIGPESGWSEDERRRLSLQNPPITLHNNVLRAETAAIVGAYAVRQQLVQYTQTR